MPETKSVSVYNRLANAFPGKLLIIYMLCLLPGFMAGQTSPNSRKSAGKADHQDFSDICAFLGGRSDKNFLGTGNLGLVIQPTSVNVIFLQKWKEGGLLDWASGSVRSWAPDRIELKEPIPSNAANISTAPVSRKVFVTRDDVLGVEFEWENKTYKEIVVQASFSGILPGEATTATGSEAGFCYSTAPYSDKVPQAIHYILGSSILPHKVNLESGKYDVLFEIHLKPHSRKTFALFLATGIDKTMAEEAISKWSHSSDITTEVRQEWNDWFDKDIPHFKSSNPYFEKLYYYRWWSLYTKMIFAKIGHFYYPAPREGTVMYEGVVSYSGACVSVDELRWMRDPYWALSTTKEFFAPENLNDGYLSNHIWDWGIDADESNIDVTGRSVPYQNYAVAAFRGAMLVHPDQGVATLRQIWPELKSNLDSYSRIFDIDHDGLYETYPWSNSAGQEWTARYSYFDPIPEMFRNERSRTYAPDGSKAVEDMDLMQKIRKSVVTDPDYKWPETADELYRCYYSTRDHRLATVDQSTYAFQNFRAATRLAELMNDTASQGQYAKMVKQTEDGILSTMWDGTDSFFYDIKPLIFKPARVKSVTGYYVFWARMAEKKHLSMMKHLFDPQTFWTEYPLPSLPLDYEKYRELQETGWTYWNYATWPRTTCHVVDGTLWAAKALDTTLSLSAAALFDRYTRMHFPDGDVNRPNIAERYDPHSGKPFWDNLDYNHSTWIDLIVQHVAGLTPQDSDDIIIDPVDMGWESFSLTNIRYRNHDIDVEFNRRKGMIVRVDGVVKARTPRLQKVVIKSGQFSMD
ncbi:MAG: hypothetical protein IPH88_03730 [Bacteroidales bacterium]|nr:hypothetical protein [Bacteroidales bacterium]